MIANLDSIFTRRGTTVYHEIYVSANSLSVQTKLSQKGSTNTSGHFPAILLSCGPAPALSRLSAQGGPLKAYTNILKKK